jgi:hypothetical protein
MGSSWHRGVLFIYPEWRITRMPRLGGQRFADMRDAGVWSSPIEPDSFHDKDWDGYDFAYKMVTVCELRQPITLKEMKEKHGFKLDIY